MFSPMTYRILSRISFVSIYLITSITYLQFRTSQTPCFCETCPNITYKTLRVLTHALKNPNNVLGTLIYP
jgi:hypothetical protein